MLLPEVYRRLIALGGTCRILPLEKCIELYKKSYKNDGAGGFLETLHWNCHITACRKSSNRSRLEFTWIFNAEADAANWVPVRGLIEALLENLRVDGLLECPAAHEDKTPCAEYIFRGPPEYVGATDWYFNLPR